MKGFCGNKTNRWRGAMQERAFVQGAKEAYLCLLINVPKVTPATELQMTYHLPTVRSNRRGFERLGELAQATEGLFADRLVLDMSRVRSFDGNMTAPLGAVLARITDRFNSVAIVAIPEKLERSFQQNRFLPNPWDEPIDDTNQTMMPFRRLRLVDEGKFEEYIHWQLSSKSINWMSERANRFFKQKVFEVYQNAVIHSESELGVFVCGQLFPREERLDFTIADAGIGIRDTVRRYFGNPRIDSLSALEWALEPRNTTKSGPQPGGLGFDLLQKFALRSEGKIQIVSRFGFYEFNRGKQSLTKMPVDFPGTAVTIGINTASQGVYPPVNDIDTNDVPKKKGMEP